MGVFGETPVPPAPPWRDYEPNPKWKLPSLRLVKSDRAAPRPSVPQVPPPQLGDPDEHGNG